MKKFFLLILALIMCLTFCGCEETEEEKAERIRQAAQEADEYLQPLRDKIEENNRKREILEAIRDGLR